MDTKSARSGSVFLKVHLHVVIQRTFFVASNYNNDNSITVTAQTAQFLPVSVQICLSESVMLFPTIFLTLLKLVSLEQNQASRSRIHSHLWIPMKTHSTSRNVNSFHLPSKEKLD